MSAHVNTRTHVTRSSRAVRALLLMLLAVACAAPLLAGAATSQAKKPISKKGLINAVKINGLTTREFIREIESRGVDFEMTGAAESEIRGAGARPEIVDAARSNYRGAAARPAVTAARNTSARPNTSTGTSPAASVPSGPPLSKDAIVELLRNGVPAERVERNVEARGVTFSMTPDIAREIKAAGGTNALVGAITEKAVSGPSSAGNNNEPDDDAGEEASGPSYEGLIDQAQASFTRQDFNSAGAQLRQAIELDPSRPIGYQLLGSWLLLGGDIASAEKAMRLALERGGSANFRVAHDHDGAFNQYCEGSFFVSKAGVSFVANDGRDTFEAEDANIKEFKTNRMVGAAYGAFHVKPVQKINNRDNFNFAPLSRNKGESELMIRLFQAF
ncbi:MAG TPA: hypothetical protein VF240_19365 [Pyrinomonadaceae bacterium]